jgi:predicted kinase
MTLFDGRLNSGQEETEAMKPLIIVAAGLPGSGKSWYFTRIGAHPISSDAVRLQLADDETDQTINTQVFQTVRYLLQQRIGLWRPVTYIDATNLTRRDRRPYIEMAREHNCGVEALWFDVPPAVCKARNAARDRKVPEHVIDQMAAKFVEPSPEEGFDRVIREIPSLNISGGVSKLTTI